MQMSIWNQEVEKRLWYTVCLKIIIKILNFNYIRFLDASLCKKRSIKIAQLLLEKGAIADDEDKEQKTALFWGFYFIHHLS